MKKIITLVATVCISLGVSAQYYYMNFLNAGQNPGGLNNDIEQPSATSAGWVVLQAPSATPVWSSNMVIPFTFNFNGAPVTTYKVSTSGVLTFTTSAVAVPASTSAALPSANIPDNSVCVWGLAGTGANDNIITKTFGSAPNRQHWIQFNSYSCIGSTGWSYWSIVLEESSNNIYVVDHRSFNAPLALAIGIQLNVTTAYQVTGSPSLGSNATLNALDTPLDNSYYQFGFGTLPVSEARLTQLTNQIYVGTPGNVSITGKITNLGSATITSIPVKYQSGVNIYTSNIATNIVTAATANFTHSIPLSIPSPGVYPVKVWVELPGDNNHTNDTLNTVINGTSFTPVHNVVVEEATGTWCGWCPRGAVYMDSLRALYPNTVNLVAVHNGDPMVVAAYDAAMGSLISGYPSGLVDRKDLNIDPTQFIASYQQHINDFGVANINVTATINAVTRAATITVNGTFAVDLSGDYRYSVVLTEDNVTGTTASFNQTNYYSGGGNGVLIGAGHEWDLESNPVPAANMVFDHVARALLGGFAGQSGSLPATIPANSTQSYTFNYTVPVNYNLSNLLIIGMLIQNSTGQILNSAKVLMPTGEMEAPSNTFSINVYPNPINDMGTLHLNLTKGATVSVEILDGTGKLINRHTEELAAGAYNQVMPLEGLSSGLYIVKVIVNGESVNRKIMISK